MTISPPEVTEHAPALENLRAELDRAGYSEANITELAGIADLRGLVSGDAGAVRARLASGGALGALVELFYLGRPVPAERLARECPGADPGAWAAAGLVQRDGASLVGQAVLMPHKELVLLADRPPGPDQPLAQDYVMDVGGGTGLLSVLTVRRPAARALDLGTGGGVLALLLAGAAKEVVGVDINRRALAFARCNALLNGVDNARFEHGDAFALPDELAAPGYELVTFHTPFVISPAARHDYCDTGHERDECCRHALLAAARSLAEGGFAHLVVNWARYRGEDWKERLAAWIEPTGCDAWVLDSGEQDPAGYALQWLVDECVGAEQREAMLARWLDYYRECGIEALYSGVIILRMRQAGGLPNWVRMDAAPDSIRGQAGHHVERVFAAQDLLQQAADDAALARVRLCPPADLRIEQRLKPEPGGWEIESCKSLLDGGLNLGIAHDPALATLIQSCNGRAELGEVIRLLARQLEEPEEDFAPVALSAARTLISLGLLTPSVRQG